MGKREQPPRRRIEMHIRISADNWDEAWASVEQIATDQLVEPHAVVRGRVNSVSGGPTRGWTIVADEDEAITHDSWAAEIRQWLDDE